MLGKMPMNQLHHSLIRLESKPSSNGDGKNGHSLSRFPHGNLAGLGSPRILVLSASVGAGHVRAAEAVELALRQIAPEAVVENIDVLRLATRPFRHCYGHIYLDLIDLAPSVLGYFYNLMDRPRPPLANGWEKLRVSLEKMSLRPFLHLLQAQPWDLIINTHFLPEEIIASLRRGGRFGAVQVMVTTDFETHRLWVHQPCDHYFTATEEAARYLQCYGVPAADTTATGIPIHPVFCAAKDRATCLARQGLVGDRPILLQLAGGYGVGPIVDLYRALLDIQAPLEIVVVTAHNSTARKHLEEIAVPPRHRAKILGFTTEIDELMAVADLVVSKPGGLTTSETLARGAGMVIVNPVPGQEERNSDYLLENGAAIKVNHLETLAYKVTEVLRDPERLAQLKANARRISRPLAAFEVAERSLALLLQRRQIRGVGAPPALVSRLGVAALPGRQPVDDGPGNRSLNHVGLGGVRGWNGSAGNSLAVLRPDML
jgi:processive 1,2-diacylglycerol beta-glucosyltransferase